MTPWHYRWLCQFAYIDLPKEAIPGLPLQKICSLLQKAHDSGSLPCGPLSPDSLEALSVLRSTPELASLTLVEFINRNSSTGLVCCLLRSPDGTHHLLFRGSETRGCGVPTGVDWLDNFLAPFAGSVQYPEIAALARRFPDAKVVFSGHSKGAHNALCALAALPSERARAVVFNGQGFSPTQLTRPQKTRLSRQAVNYVTRTDPVGALLYHPERRVFTKARPSVHPHALSAFLFDRKGRPLPALRSLRSYAIEFSSRAALLRTQILPCAGSAVHSRLPL